jgi:hypothetical protein
MKVGTRVTGITLGPSGTKEKLSVLWKAKLKIQNETGDFLFRSTEEMLDAAAAAERILQSSPSCKMVGAVIVGVERVAKLWN